MEPLRKQLRRRCLSRIPLCLICLFAPIMCLVYLIQANLPEASHGNLIMESRKALVFPETVEGLGEFGDMMLTMLPDDLAFTVFAPSEEAIRQSLKLKPHDSLSKDKYNNTYAIISRVMGFSTVPQHIPSETIPSHTERAFDSISGLKLYAWKDFDGTLVVNGIRSATVDMRKSEIIVHIMNGVLMDAAFEQSFASDEED
ncbi:uncharacterized protein LOC122015518 [Zingiber officinale]|nr:uncharacterized protein LOC122015518 [Zingiber officinale]